MQSPSFQPQNGVKQEEIRRLAFIIWEKDGRPQGRDLEYWLQAESQLKATWHLLVREHSPDTPDKIRLDQNASGISSKRTSKAKGRNNFSLPVSVG